MLKGAPERVLERCNGVLRSDGSTIAFKNDKEKEKINARVKQEASKGYRILGIAIAKDGGKMKHIKADNIEKELADPAQY